jgi:hypothetical protein
MLIKADREAGDGRRTSWVWPGQVLLRTLAQSSVM